MNVHDFQEHRLPSKLTEPLQLLRQVTTAYYTVPGGTSLVCRCPTNTRVHEQVLRLVVSLNDQQYEGLGLPAAVHQPVKLYATTPLSGKKPSVDLFDRDRCIVLDNL